MVVDLYLVYANQSVSQSYLTSGKEHNVLHTIKGSPLGFDRLGIFQNTIYSHMGIESASGGNLHNALRLYQRPGSILCSAYFKSLTPLAESGQGPRASPGPQPAQCVLHPVLPEYHRTRGCPQLCGSQ